MTQRLIPAGEQSGLQTRSLLTLSSQRNQTISGTQGEAVQEN